MTFNDCEITNETTLEQIQTINDSQFWLIAIIVSISLSYITLGIQKKQIIAATCAPECLECLPDVFPIRKISSALVILGLFFFYTITQKNLKANTDCSNFSPVLNHVSSELVLAAALIRLFDLYYTNRSDT